jgi:tetratricopeptide (TPR) repeat protein
MKKIYFLGLVFLLGAMQISAQSVKKNIANYYKYLEKAIEAAWIDDLPSKAVRYFDSASTIHELRPQHFLLIAECYLELGDTLKALLEIEKGFSRGITQQQAINRFRKIGYYNYKDAYKATMQKYPKLRREYFNEINVDALLKINQIYSRDQLIREESIINDIQIEMFNKIDSLNFQAFKEFVTEYGFPGCSLLGCESNIEPLIAHWVMYDDNSFKYLDSLMMKAIFEGEFQPQDYAWIIDRRRSFGKKGDALYGGTWPEEEYEMIEDIANVDKRRSEIFLPSLEYDSKITNRSLPDSYLKLKKK